MSAYKSCYPIKTATEIGSTSDGASQTNNPLRMLLAVHPCRLFLASTAFQELVALYHLSFCPLPSD